MWRCGNVEIRCGNIIAGALQRVKEEGKIGERGGRKRMEAEKCGGRLALSCL